MSTQTVRYPAAANGQTVMRHAAPEVEHRDLLWPAELLEAFQQPAEDPEQIMPLGVHAAEQAVHVEDRVR
jgi:hypothetical protein